jgi:citrate/tricarballylate utilization protein
MSADSKNFADILAAGEIISSDDLMHHGEHVMTVCNSCRYCEGYCPVFPAMENRLTFLQGDLRYLANLCHNCGECLYACQYAPPHEFGINVPQTLAQIRLRSYEAYCWPRALGVAFRRHGLRTALGTALLMALVMGGYTLLAGVEPLVASRDADFYQVVPHHLMVGLFGGVSLFVVVALVIGVIRCWRDGGPAPAAITMTALVKAVRDAVSLKHLHDGGVDCTHAEEDRSPWRRWFHHATVGGFMLCFASTSVAALYHGLGWHAPYAYTSLPVVLGTAGGLGLLVGPAGLMAQRRRRDPSLMDAAQDGLDQSFIILLLLSSLTGLVLLVARERAIMGSLLLIHLSFVLTLFLTLPYGKFVHGIYRTAALIRYELEVSRSAQEIAQAAAPAPERPFRPVPLTDKATLTR